MSHTPGPWKVGFSDESGCGEGAYITDGADDVIVRGGSPEGDIDYGVLTVANARLIAAAPMLLAEAKKYRELLRALLVGETVKIDFCALDAAIAAAESD